MDKVPGFLRKYIGQRGGGYHEYAVLRLQASVVFMFLISLVLTARLSVFLLLALGALLTANVYSLWRDFRKVPNRFAYWFFFGGLTLFAIVLGFSKIIFTGFDLGFLAGYAISFAAFLLAYKIILASKEAPGKVVLCDKEWAVVYIPFDVASGVPNGHYAVRSKPGIKKGDSVRVKTFSSALGRGKEWEIAGKAKS